MRTVVGPNLKTIFMTFFKHITDFHFWCLCVYFSKDLTADTFQNVSGAFFFTIFLQDSNTGHNYGGFPCTIKFKYNYQFFNELDFCVNKYTLGIMHTFEYLLPTLRCLDFISELSNGTHGGTSAAQRRHCTRG